MEIISIRLNDSDDSMHGTFHTNLSNKEITDRALVVYYHIAFESGDDYQGDALYDTFQELIKSGVLIADIENLREDLEINLS